MKKLLCMLLMLSMLLSLASCAKAENDAVPFAPDIGAAYEPSGGYYTTPVYSADDAVGEDGSSPGTEATGPAAATTTAAATWAALWPGL